MDQGVLVLPDRHKSTLENINFLLDQVIKVIHNPSWMGIKESNSNLTRRLVKVHTSVATSQITRTCKPDSVDIQKSL